MNRITLYKKGGKLYYKKGGKMCLYQGGGDVQPLDSTTFRINDPATNQILNEKIEPVNAYDNPRTKGKGFDWRKLAGIASMVGTGISNLSDEERARKQLSDNKYYRSAFGGDNENKSKISGVFDTAGGIVSSVNPMIGGIVQAGRGLTKAIINEDPETGIAQTTAQRVIGNVLSPSTKMQKAIETGGKYGAGYGVADYFTFGAAGEELRRKTKEKADAEEQFDKSRMAMYKGNTEGVRRNDTIYARYGKDITIKPGSKFNDNWNAEIEDGEIALGNPATMVHGGNSYTSMVSPFAVKFTGDKHGQDTDGDGQEGIPIKAQEGTYIASNYLGVDGKKAKDGKTVAKEMEPIVESLADADTNSMDVYKNNPHFINNQLEQLTEIKEEAEENKAAEELKKLLSKKDRNMSEISAFIQENAQYLLDQPEESNEELPVLQQGPVMQTGGKIIPRSDMEDYAVNEMDIPRQLAELAEEDNPGNYSFTSPDQYKQYLVDAFKEENNVLPTKEEINVLDKDITIDEREGGREDIRTMEQLAGKSQYTGTSNLIQKKVREMLDENIFDGTGHLSKDWINKLVNEHNVPREEAESTTMETITEGNVGKAIGKELQQAYGVLGKGKDEQDRTLDSNINNKTDRPVINNQVEWAQGIIDDIKDNQNQLPSQYTDLPEDLKDELLNLARNDKQAFEGVFSPSLKNEFIKANESVASELGRQQSVSFKDEEVESAKIDSNYDLFTDGIDGKQLSFGEAFKYARENSLPTFTWKGKSYAAKTKSEAPELSGQSRAIKGSADSKPTMTTNIKPQEMQRKVKNPSRTLRSIMQTGGYTGPQYGPQFGKGRVNMRKYNELQKAKAESQKLSDKLALQNMMSKSVSVADQWGKPLVDMGKINPKLYNYTSSPEDKPVGLQFNNKPVLKNKPSLMIEQGRYKTLQEGGPIPGEEQTPNESSAHLQQLIAQQMQGDPNAMMQPGMEEGMEGPQETQSGVPPVLAELDPQLQQVFMSLSPDQQEQLLAIGDPAQIEIMLINMMNQVGPQQAQGPAAPQGPVSTEVPAGVMNQFM